MSGSHEPAQQGVRQRLIICFDGTWNSRDSGTNVTNIANLVKEGLAADGLYQRVYYDPGVGTAKLDRVTGGAFGEGLSANVCEAYDWLIEQYTQDDVPGIDGDDHDDAFDCEHKDHIYIFGFSRGAFTARSLVGLIAKCGLLKRGAPLPLDQLWQGYQLLGRYPSARQGGRPQRNWWERVWGSPDRTFRELWELTHRKGLSLNATERLLVEWSRRPPIRCVAVFDTVGSLGIDALAIPGLRTKVAKFHDTRLTSLIVNGFQALAIDENRANFAHIPWHHELKTKVGPGKSLRGGRIEQRWFVGAHSNVGGGLENDLLAQFPLRWMMDQCKSLGLEFRNEQPPLPIPKTSQVSPLLHAEPPKPHLETPKPYFRDTYTEFAGGLWRYLIRAKRAYRRLEPPPEMLYGEPAQSVNETMDSSVSNFIQTVSAYRPPNAWDYLHRHDPATWPDATAPAHKYVDGLKDFGLLAAWVIATLAGAHALVSWLGPWIKMKLDLHPPQPTGWWIAVAFAVFALGIDWIESRTGYAQALRPDSAASPMRVSLLNVLVAVRIGLIAVIACAAVWLAIGLVKWFMVGSTWTNYLLCFALLWFLFQTALNVQAKPTSSLGMASVVELQKKRTPADVTAFLEKWGGKPPSPGLVRAFGESLWLDALVFIPVYTTVFLASAWLTLRTGIGPHFGIDPYRWWPWYAAAMLACAVADWLEDSVHLSYLRPKDGAIQPPSQGRVLFATSMTLLKYLLFMLGFGVSILAAARMVHLQVRAGSVGGLGFVAIALVVIFVVGVFMQFARAPAQDAD